MWEPIRRQLPASSTAEFEIVAADPHVTNPETIENLTYNGQAQALVTPGRAEGGVMLYTVTDSTVATAPEDASLYTESGYYASDAGSYKVWYRVKGDPNYKNVAPEALSVSIGKGNYSGEKTLIERIITGEAMSTTRTLPDLPEGAAYDTAVTVSGNSAGWISEVTLNGYLLTYTVTAQNEPAAASIIIPVKGAKNYNDYDLTVLVSAKNDAGVRISTEDAVVKTYTDESFNLGASAEHTGSSGVWTYTSSNETAATVSDTGQVTITGVGQTKLTALYESDTTMGQASVILTVNKATPQYDTPQIRTLPCNARLADISLPEHFSLEEGNAALVLGENTVKVRYTPADTANYEVVDDIAIKVTLQHSLQETKAAAATYDAPGNSAYYTCTNCRKHFSDAGAGNEIAEGSWVIGKLEKKESAGSGSGKPSTGSSDPDSGKTPAGTEDKDNTPTKKGDVGTDTKTGAEVKITNDSDKNPTAEYSGPADLSAASAEVPDMVTFGGKTFKVTTVKPNAFVKSKATKVTFGKNVTKISPKALNGSKIKTIIIKSKKLSKKSVKNALKGCKAKKVTIKIKVGKKSENRKYLKKYKKFFTAKNVGKKVTLK